MKTNTTKYNNNARGKDLRRRSVFQSLNKKSIWLWEIIIHQSYKNIYYQVE